MPFIYLSTDEPDRARMWLERLEAAPVETLDYWYLYAALLVALTDALAETPPARLDALSRAVHAQGTESSHVGQLAIVEGTLNQTDDPQRALECFDRAAETGRAVGNYFIEEAGIGRSSWPLLRMRRRPDAIERAVRMLELVRRRGNPTNAMVNGAAIPALLAATDAYDVAVMFVELHRQHVPSSAHVVERLLRETGYWERLQRPKLDHARSEAIHTTPAELVDLTIAALDPARIKPT
jgi:hypothetical protein